MGVTANDDTSVAWTFHDATKYVPRADATGFAMGTPPHLEDPIWEQDRSLEPFPYKIYDTLDPLGLPREFPSSPVPALEALASTGAAGSGGGHAVVDLAALARIGLLSNGRLDRHLTTGDGRVIEYRAAGGTGARYHLEEYFVCGDLPDLPAGVYHYDAHDHSLRQLRSGDFRGAVVAAGGGEPALAAAAAVLVMTSTFWRNAWRYKARAYRHTYWDAGTTLSHVLAVSASMRLPATVVMGFVDADVNALLGVDGVREAAVALCALGRGSGDTDPARGEPAGPRGVRRPDVPPLDLPSRAISPREVTFPLIPRLHAASSLDTPAEVGTWRSGALRRVPAAPTGPLVPLAPTPAGELPTDPVEEIIVRRRSTRHYDVDSELSFAAFSTLLDRSSGGFAADCLLPGAASLHDRYLIVHGVEGLAPGVYRHHRDAAAVELLREGDFRSRARDLAVGQWYTADAHVNAYYLTDLREVLAAYGNRGYRLAQLEAALFAGRLHLGTHAAGRGVEQLGAVGSTSSDDEVVEFFSPAAAGTSYMFVTVFGRRRARRRH